MKISDEKLKSWQNLSISLSVATGLMLLVSLLVNAGLIIKYFDTPEKIVLKDIEILTTKSPKGTERSLRIYQAGEKRFTASCLTRIDVCTEFRVKMPVMKIVGIKQTKRHILIQEITFSDGKVHVDLDENETKLQMDYDFHQAIRSLLTFSLATIFFIILSVFISKKRKNYGHNKWINVFIK